LLPSYETGSGVWRDKLKTRDIFQYSGYTYCLKAMSFFGKRGRPKKKIGSPPNAAQELLFPYQPRAMNVYRGGIAEIPLKTKLFRTSKDLRGRKFGELEVIRDSGKRSRSRGVIWECKCDCGLLVLRISTALSCGKTISCGHNKTTPEAIAKRGLSQRKPNAAIRHEWRHYKTAAKERAMLFALSFEEFMAMVSMNCFYCGIVPSRLQISPAGHNSALMNGIDRYDNSEGYIKSNCVPCCRRCNLMKHAMDAGEFIAHVRQIVDFQSTGGVKFPLKA
jgi:hypothetical protein